MSWKRSLTLNKLALKEEYVLRFENSIESSQHVFTQRHASHVTCQTVCANQQARRLVVQSSTCLGQPGSLPASPSTHSHPTPPKQSDRAERWPGKWMPRHRKRQEVMLVKVSVTWLVVTITGLGNITIVPWQRTFVHSHLSCSVGKD